MRSRNTLILRSFLVPRARLLLARQYDPSQDFKSCASTNFATGAKGLKSDFRRVICQSRCAMIAKRQWIVDSIRLTGALARQQWLPLGLVFLISCSLNLSIEDAMQNMPSSEETQRWVMQLGLGLWDLLEGILLLLILSWGIPKVSRPHRPSLLAQPFATPYLGSFLAEYLRVLAQVLMWGLLLILPGFVRYAQIVFVPLIVFFSKSYREGHQDALRLSHSLSRGRLLPIFTALGVTMGLEVGLEFLPEMIPDLHILVIRIFLALTTFLISAWTYSLIFLMFENAMQEAEAQ